MPSSPITDPALNALLQALLLEARRQYEPLGLAYQLLYETGCRWNEITYLDEWEFIYGGSAVKFQTKKTKAYRTIDVNLLSAESVALIADGGGVLAYQSYDRAKLLMANILSSQGLSVGRKHLYLHAFRHNYARRQKAAGLSAAQVQADMALKSEAIAYRYMFEPIIQHHP